MRDRIACVHRPCSPLPLRLLFLHVYIDLEPVHVPIGGVRQYKDFDVTHTGAFEQGGCLITRAHEIFGHAPLFRDHALYFTRG